MQTVLVKLLTLSSAVFRIIGLHAGTKLWSACLRGSLILVLLGVLAAFIYGLVRIGLAYSMALAFALAFLPLTVTVLFQQRIRGAVGEFMVRVTLAFWFPASSRFNDLYLPRGETITQIDHVLVCPRGVFVIETKNWYGTIYGHPENAHWNRGSSHGPTLYNPLRQNQAHVEAVQEALGQHQSIHGIVAMVGRVRLQFGPAEGLVRGLAALVTAIHRRPEALDVVVAAELSARLRAAALPKTRVTIRAHRRAVRRHH